MQENAHLFQGLNLLTLLLKHIQWIPNCIMYVMTATGGEAGSTREFGVGIYRGLFLGSTGNLNALVSDYLTFLCTCSGVFPMS